MSTFSATNNSSNNMINNNNNTNNNNNNNNNNSTNNDNNSNNNSTNNNNNNDNINNVLSGAGQPNSCIDSNSVVQNTPSSMFLVVNPLPSNEDELNDKIFETVEKLRLKTSIHNNSGNQNSSNNGSVNNANQNVAVVTFSNVSCSSSTAATATLPGSFYLHNKFPIPQCAKPSTQTVIECVISRTHIAVLFDDNRICRFPYTISVERLTANNQQESSTTNSQNNHNASNNNTTSSSSSKKLIYNPVHFTNNNSNNNNNNNNTNSGSNNNNNNNNVTPSSPITVGRNVARRRLVRRGGRGGGPLVMSRSMIPAQYVPEELINQAQVVLQGKSRNVIIRELQRTNLDVNSAVNNLLSRDDEDFEDGDDTTDHLIHSEDLMSLLDSRYNDHSVIIDPDFSDEVFSYPLSVRGSLFSSNSQNNNNTSGGGSTNNSNNAGSNSSNATTRQMARLRSEDFYSEREVNSSQKGRSKKKVEQVQLSPISFMEQEYWLGSNEREFIHIAAMHSELIAITHNGQLCQWRWQDSEPFQGVTNEGLAYFHPRAPSLGLLSEKLIFLSASIVRATVVSASNKIATWTDESIANVANKLEHSITNAFPETVSSVKSLKITSLYVSSLMSCIRVLSGDIYWWGMPPYSYRKKLTEKSQSEMSKSKSKPIKDNGIANGSLVCMRNSPTYQIGAIGFTTLGGVPKVGQLVTAAWNISDSYMFRVLTPQEIQYRHYITLSNNAMSTLNVPNSGNKNAERSEMPPPPSPASSTSSESSAPSVKRSRVRQHSSNQNDNNQEKLNTDKNDKTEVWNLRDVVFLEDVKNTRIGRVLKVDGNFVAVKFLVADSFISTPINAKNNEPIPSTATAQQSQTSSRSTNSVPPTSPNTAGIIDSSVDTIMECRLMRKEDLVPLRGSALHYANYNKAFDYFQRTPKRVPIAEHLQILAMTLSNLGLHVISKVGFRISYQHINIVSGKIEHENKLSIENIELFINTPKSIRLFSAGENEQTTVVLCRDGNGTLYPMAKDCTNTMIRQPMPFNLGSISSIGLGIYSLSNLNNGAPLPPSSSNSTRTHAAIIAFALERQHLIPAILNSDLDSVRECLGLLAIYPSLFKSMIYEVCDGNHNILHISVSACFPTSNKSHTTNDSVQIHLQVLEDDDEMDRSKSIGNDSNDNSMDTQQSLPENIEPVLDPTEQKPIAHSILWSLLDSPALAPYLFDLLSACDYQGLTPFMLAIAGRAYSAAQQIFVVMQRVARKIASNNENNTDSNTQEIYDRNFMQMLYPRGSLPDHSPLYMLCCNDTCSFTWTGEEHINQDIFECRTCGLIGSLCCCTECAQVCHRGHDCKLKRTSPTAYCDCWEKCKCKALISGCQPARYNLLKRLLSTTDLSQRVNSRGEHILLFLVQTVSRQMIEQKQYRPTRLRPFSSNNSRSKNDNNEDQNIPEHDLEPPKFARKALEKMFVDWPTVKSMILTGYRSPENGSRRRAFLWDTSNSFVYEEENALLSRQNGSALLDKFIHLLLKSGQHDSVDRITNTIVAACKNQSKAQEAKITAKRFVRSIIRVSLVLMFETNPSIYANAFAPFGSIPRGSFVDRYLSLSLPGTPNTPKKPFIILMLRKIRRVFVALLPIACEELCEIAESLIVPVKFGMARPTSSFMMIPPNSNNEFVNNITDDLFSVDSSVYLHQRDFLDSAYILPNINDPNRHQNNLPSMNWNSFHQSSSSVTNNTSESFRNTTNDNNQQQQQQQQDVINQNANNNNETNSSRLFDLQASNESNTGSVSAPNVASSADRSVEENSIMESNENNLAAEVDMVMEMVTSETDDISNVGGRDTESDSESNPDDASYLSTADNASAQRSVVTGATAGSDVGVASLPYDDESLNSNPDEVDDDDDDEQDMEPDGEHDDDDSSDSSDVSDAAETEPDPDGLFHAINENVDRRTSSGNNNNSSTSNRQSVIQQIHWALRGQRDHPSGSNSEPFRRSAISNTLVSVDNVVQVSNSLVGLSRSFSIIIRHIADLMVIVRDPQAELEQVNFQYLPLTSSEYIQLAQLVEERLRNNWSYVNTCLSSIESQLRFGCALSNRRLTPGASNSIPGSLSNYDRRGYGRLRAFQSQDELPILPTYRNNFRRNPPVAGGSRSGNGNSSSNSNNNSNSGNAPNSSTFSESNQAAHRDFLNYTMSLMRAHSNEHYDSLPVLDVSSQKHIAYIFDAMMYYMRRGVSETVKRDFNERSDIMADFQASLGKKHKFFRRSSSTLYLGCPRPDPFLVPYHEALPLASRPQLLTPTARKEELFGIPRPSNPTEAELFFESLPIQMSLVKKNQWNLNRPTIIPTTSNTQSLLTQTRNQSVITESRSSLANKLSVIVMAGSAKPQPNQSNTNPINEHNYVSKSLSKYAASLHKYQFFGNIPLHFQFLAKWRLTLELFGRLFVDDVSLEPHSIIPDLTEFPVKESKFRREMERLRISCTTALQRDLNFYKLERDRNLLLVQTFKELNSAFSSVTRRLNSQISLISQPLTITRVKVIFKDEPGEGSGVARSFYTAFSEAVLANEKLPPELFTNGNNANGSIRQSTGSNTGPFETYTNYMIRLRSSNNNNSGNNSTTNSNNSNVNIDTTMIRGNRGLRFRTQTRRPHLIERIRNMHEPRYPNTNTVNTTNSGTSTLPSIVVRRQPILRYEASSYIPYRIVSVDARSTLAARVYNRAFQQYPIYAGKITGMIIDLYDEMGTLVISDEDINSYINYAMEIIHINELRNNPLLNNTSSITVTTSTVSISTIPSVVVSTTTAPLITVSASTTSSTSVSAATTSAPLTSTSTSISSTSTSSSNINNNVSITNQTIAINDDGLHPPTTAPAPTSAFSTQTVSGQQPAQSQSQTQQSISPLSAQMLGLLTNDLIFEALKPTNKPAGEATDFPDDDNAPLFYQPGLRGFYSPRQGRSTEIRLNAFRNVGRIIGVCFVQNELCPISFNRHVIKMILGYSVSWHDLAFFDSELYESLRQLILDAESNNKDDIFNDCDFRFAIDLPPEEGGQEVELIPNGRNVRVTPQNVYDYVRYYALYRMVDSQEKAIMAIRAGIFDVIPLNAFEGLSAEDFRLLLNGVKEIDVQQLQTYVTFHDESGDADPISTFRKWFWWVVERMTNEEKQDLIYFWTGSPALPASEEGFQPMPSVTIRPRDDYYFVTANTCISRLYIPLYSSRNVLRQKLLMSIKSKSFGFI